MNEQLTPRRAHPSGRPAPLQAGLSLLVTLTLLLAGLLAAPQGASAVSPDVVISQVYGGGGNSGATLKNDFIELYNRGATPVDLSGWSVQYASATGSAWQRTNLSGTLAPGAHYLVQEAAGAGGTTDLPAPDATGSIPMSATNGKVALVTSQTLLTCGGATNNCFPNPAIRDFVGYGSTANNYEGAGPTATLSNTTAALRLDGGATDTDNNSADFTIGAPNPRNSGGAPPPPPPPATRIRDIQGAAHTSPLAGQRVAEVPGVVTALRGNGFYFQDPSPDADSATSEGLFVFTSSRPTVRVGDAVRVSGTAGEFIPGGPSSGNLSTTQLTSPTVTIESSGNALPAPTVVGIGGRIPPTTVIDDDGLTSFDPAHDGIDFYESLEGMLLQVNNAVAVSPTNRFGEIAVLADHGAGAGVRTPRGGIVIRQGDFNPERLILDDAIVDGEPIVNVGDSFPGAIVGVLDYSFGNFKLLNTVPLPAPVAGGLARETTAVARPTELTVATFNVENLDPQDDPAKFAALADVIVGNLRSPLIVALEEVQDNNGPTNDEIVAANATYERLIAAIAAAGGPAYDYRQIDPVDDRDGGQPGGNIRVGFLFRTDYGLKFVDRPGGDATTAARVLDGPTGPHLSVSPGRIAPTDPAFTDSRKPLVGEFTYRGQTLFVIANHFVSKGGDQPLFGRNQPPVRGSETQRRQQAQIVNSFVDEILAADPKANVIVLGDINDFQFSEVMDTLKGGVLHNLLDTLPPGERYSYVFDGNSQALDHILVSRSLLGALVEHDVVHVNAEFADQISDHDPQVARFAFDPPPGLPIPLEADGRTAD